LAALLVVGCLLILRPFIPLIMWGVIIAVASYPSFRKLQTALSGRGGLTAALFTLILLSLLIIPVVLLAQSLVEGIQSLAAHMRDGTLTIPPPRTNIENWPIIGAPLKSVWGMASTNLTGALRMFAPQIKAVIPGVLSATAGIGLTVLQFVLSIVVSGVLLANAQSAYEVTRALANRLFGEKGPEFQKLIGSTIRSVTTGISRRCAHPNGLRRTWLFTGRTARRRFVGSDLSDRRRAPGVLAQREMENGRSPLV